MHPDGLSLGGGPLEGDGLYVPSSILAIAQNVGTVTVPTNAPRLIVRLFAATGAPRYSLIEPDGTRLTPDAPGASTYQQIADTKETYYVVSAPAAGGWSVQAEDGSKGPFVLDAWGANAPPSIASLSATQNGASVTINYDATDPDDNTPVSLSYDTSPSGFRGVLIAENLPNGQNGTYTWNTAAASLASGDYYIYLTMDDGRNVPVQRYATTRITILDPNAPATPNNVKVQPGGENSLLVTWDSNSEPNLHGYSVHHTVDQGAATSLDQIVDVGKTNSLRLTRLQNNTAYRVSVIAYTQIEAAQATATQPRLTIHKSLGSAPLTAKTGAANPPRVRVTSPEGRDRLTQGSINVSWKLENADDAVDQQIDLSLDGGRNWRSVAKHLAPGQRNYRWDIPGSLQSSRARIRVSVLDLAGNESVGATTGDISIMPLDSDGDGIPDAWEIAHGLDPFSKPDALVDTNGDGVTNLEKYYLGLDPRDPKARFQPAVTVDSNGIQISFGTVAGRFYRVERSDDLGSQNWEVVDENIPGSGTSVQVREPSDSMAKTRFYRISVTL